MAPAHAGTTGSVNYYHLIMERYYGILVVLKIISGSFCASGLVDFATFSLSCDLTVSIFA